MEKLNLISFLSVGFLFLNSSMLGTISSSSLISFDNKFENFGKDSLFHENYVDIVQKKKSILITGGIGFIGMHTAISLKEDGYNVVVIDNMNSYYSIELKVERLKKIKEAGIHFIKGDVCDESHLNNIFNTYNVERVVHLAAQAGVRYSLESPHSYTRNNVDCFVSILEQVRKNDLMQKPIIYASSSSVYGFNNKAPFNEDISDVDHPASLYAATKRANELFAHTYNHLYNISSIGLRFFTVYGPWGRPDMSPMIFADKISRNETITLSNYGDCLRDFTFVTDIVEGIKASLKVKTQDATVVNLGGTNPIGIRYFLSLMEQNLGLKAETKLAPLSKGDVPMTSADTRKAYSMMGWAPKVSIETGLKKFLDWYSFEKASQYMKKKKEICFVSSSFGHTQNDLDEIWNVNELRRNDETLEFYFFSNLDLDHSTTGWKNITLKDLQYQRMITASRFPKFLAWKHPIIQDNCVTIFYLDASCRPVPKLLRMLPVWKMKVLESEVGFATPTHYAHSRRKYGMEKEMDAILKHKKDTVENMNKTLSWMKTLPDYKPDIKVFENTYFMYSIKSPNWQNLTENCFWKYYSLETGSWRDQPYFAYCVHHLQFEPLKLPGRLFKSGQIGHNNHIYVN